MLHAGRTARRRQLLVRADALDVELFVAAFPAPPRLLLLGGGPDARPVASSPRFSAGA